MDVSLDEIERCAAVIRAGGLAAFPTETVYGLGADATNGIAVARIFEVKGRPSFNPLIVHVPTAGEAAALGQLDGTAAKLAAAFWPGPLTLVVPLTEEGRAQISPLSAAGLDTVGLRVPSHPVARALLHAAGRPVAAPSANRSGHVSPTTAEHVRDDLGQAVDRVLDGGATPVGIESTVVACADDKAQLLRPGGVSRQALEKCLGQPLTVPADNATAPTAPGQLASHYAPRARVRVNALHAEPGEVLLGFGPGAPPDAANLSPRGELREAAANLFAMLRALDRDGVAAIAVMPIPGHGLGEAINDRLRRAAAPRP
jgi:L-threonylcarbamoyladenylate synthase